MTKQVIVIRKDLNMRKGKMVAQGAHASMAVLLNAGKMHTAHGGSFELDEEDFGKFGQAVFDWLCGAFTKICVSVDSEERLIEIYNNAKAAGLPCSLITDSGKTEFGGVPTNTAVAVGPAESDQVDAITGNLPLL